SPGCPRLLRERGEQPGAAADFHAAFGSMDELGDQPPLPHLNTADVWEEVHRVTGRPVLADAYTRLYALSAVMVGRKPLFDALCQVGDALGARWKQDGEFLLCRSTSYFWDKLKEVPNRDLARWQRDSQREGGLPFSDLLEMASLSDPQLDSTRVRQGIRHCW